MKNKKAICTVILAGVLIILAIVFKDNMPKVIHYGICFLGIITAFLAAYIEKKKK